MEEHVLVGCDAESGLLKVEHVVVDGEEMKSDPMPAGAGHVEGVSGIMDEDPRRQVNRGGNIGGRDRDLEVVLSLQELGGL